VFLSLRVNEAGSCFLKFLDFFDLLNGPRKARQFLSGNPTRQGPIRILPTTAPIPSTYLLA